VRDTPVAEKTSPPPDCAQVVRQLALDLQQALARKGRAPFVLSGLPLFEDLCALRQALARCLALAEDLHLRQWHTLLEQTLPSYEAAFQEVRRAGDWVDGLKVVLDAPRPTPEKPGAGGDTVARQVAHYLGTLGHDADLSPWLKQFRANLWALSERYWSGLFHCYDIVGLPPTNNDHESLYGQTKRRLRRQLGVSELRESLLRHGAWAILQIDADSTAKLQERLAQVSWQDYAAERARYDHRQAQFRRRYRWRHQRDAVLQQRVTDWAGAVSGC